MKRSAMQRFTNQGATATAKLRKLSTSHNVSHGTTFPVEIMTATGWKDQDMLRLTVIDEKGVKHIVVTRLAG